MGAAGGGCEGPGAGGRGSAQRDPAATEGGGQAAEADGAAVGWRETVAVKVTDCPTTKVFEVVVKAVVVGIALTTSESGELSEDSSPGTAVLPL